MSKPKNMKERMNFKDFENKIKQDCLAAGVNFVCSENNRVYYQGLVCNGYFEPEYPIELNASHILGEDMSKLDSSLFSGKTSMVLAAAKGGKTEVEFYSLLAHEYSHLCQYIEKSKYWIATEDFMVWENWLSGKETKDEVLHEAWSKVVMLEADCERRVIQLIKDLDLQIDVEEYARRANSYLYFHSWCLKNRVWYKTAPYEIDKIVSIMPKVLCSSPEDYTSSELLNEELMGLFDACK